MLTWAPEATVTVPVPSRVPPVQFQFVNTVAVPFADMVVPEGRTLPSSLGALEHDVARRGAPPPAFIVPWTVVEMPLSVDVPVPPVLARVPPLWTVTELPLPPQAPCTSGLPLVGSSLARSKAPPDPTVIEPS